MALRPCPTCARHVRASESACPFCAAELGDERPSASVTASGVRLGRAAMFVAGTAVAAAALAGGAGCGPEKPKPNPNLQKPYGAPPAEPVWA